MQALEFWKTITVDQANLLERLVALLEGSGLRYCVVGGQGVNAYAEPLVSLDLDLAIASDDVAALERLLPQGLRVKRFAHTVNVTAEGSDLRVQFQTDPRYASFPDRAERRSVLGLELPVASLEDVLAGKVWAAQDTTHRPSKRLKDLTDIARLLEAYPDLRGRVPAELLGEVT